MLVKDTLFVRHCTPYGAPQEEKAGKSSPFVLHWKKKGIVKGESSVLEHGLVRLMWISIELIRLSEQKQQNFNSILLARFTLCSRFQNKRKCPFFFFHGVENILQNEISWLFQLSSDKNDTICWLYGFSVTLSYFFCVRPTPRRRTRLLDANFVTNRLRVINHTKFCVQSTLIVGNSETGEGEKSVLRNLCTHVFLPVT